MTHSLCKSDAAEAIPHFERVGRTLLAPSMEARTALERLFEDETTEFGLKYAYLSYVDLAHETERFELVHGSHEKIRPGTTVPLAETYCRKTIADPDGTLAVSDALDEGWADDPAYERFGLRSYLGATVPVADELYGTLCFVDTAARDEPLVDEEKALIGLYGQWVGYVLKLRGEPRIRENPGDTSERRAVSSDAIDSMMDALASPTRRDILATLLGVTTGISIPDLERRLDSEDDRIRLHHVHLPKLVASGYVTWDGVADTISRGPKFSEVEPLVRLLTAYETALPE
jgi:hypothetical protein